MKRQITIQKTSTDTELAVKPAAAAQRKDRRLFWSFGVMFVAACVMSLFSSNFEEELSRYVPETVTNTSSYNKKPSGYAGLYELCQNLKYSTRRWQSPYRELKGGGTLIMVSPTMHLKDFEVDQVLKWVEQGNRLVYLDFFAFRITGKQILEPLHLEAIEATALTDTDVSTERTPVCEHASSVNITAESRLSSKGAGKAGANNVVLVKDERGNLMLDVPYGKGHCLISTAPSFCCNRRIAEKESKGNFQLLANWLKDTPGTVYFDEKCHGFSEAKNIFAWLGKGPMGLVSLQIGIILAVALISLNQRFGPAKRVSTPRRISNLEFIDGMAHTYRKARASDTAWSIIFSNFKSRLCRALGATPESSVEELSASWSSATGLNAAECNAFLTKGLKAEADHITNEELLELVGNCDKLTDHSKNYLAIGSTRRLGG